MAEVDDFMTPPRPPNTGKVEDFPDFPLFPGKEGRLAVLEAQQALDQYDPSEINEETVHTIAAAFDVDPSALVAPQGAQRDEASASAPAPGAARTVTFQKTVPVKEEVPAPPGLEVNSGLKGDGPSSSHLCGPCVSTIK